MSRLTGVMCAGVLFVAASLFGGAGGCGSSGSGIATDDEPPSAFEEGGDAQDGASGEEEGDASEALGIVAMQPAADAQDVSLLAEISVTFDRPLLDTEIASASLALSDAGAAVEGATSFEDGNARIVFTPASPLERGVLYTASLTVVIDAAAPSTFEGLLDWAFATDASYYVSPAGDDTGEGMREFPWKSIQYAVDTVPAGSTVRLLEGAYAEAQTILVSQSLNIVGAGSDATTIGAPAAVGAGFIDQTILDVAGADDGVPDNIAVTIEDLTVDAAETPGLKFGVLLRGGAYAEVRNCVLRGAMEAQGSVNSGNITVGWNDFGYRARALIENNLITDFHSFGIAVYGTGNEAVIRGNEIAGNASMHICSSNPGNWAGAMGIVIQSNESTTVEDNTITGMRRNPACNPACYDAAIETYWPGDMVIARNHIEDNDYGFASYATMGSAASLVLEGNDILGNDLGVQLGNLNVVSVRENNFEGNALFGLRNTMAGAVDVSDNFWGAVDGPNPPGSGDAVSGNLVTAPFSATPW